MEIDLSTFELHNIIPTNGELRARRGLRKQAAPATGSVFVAGWSVKSPNTGDLAHYLVSRDRSTGIGTIDIVDESFREIVAYSIGQIPRHPRMTYGRQRQQVLINSPDMAVPAYGIVGGGLIRAVGQEGVNELNSAHLAQIPQGLSFTFGDRIGVVQGDNIFFNDDGSAENLADIRTFVGTNVNFIDGVITDAFETQGVGLNIITDNGVWVLPTDALGQGEIVVGALTKTSDYRGVNHRNAVSSGGGVWYLTRDHLVVNGEEISLTSYSGSRYRSRYVGTSAAGDLREGKIFALSDGVLVAVNHAVCIVRSADLKPIWIYPQGDLDVVGVLQSSEGKDLLLTDDGVLEFIGNVDYLFQSESITGSNSTLNTQVVVLLQTESLSDGSYSLAGSFSATDGVGVKTGTFTATFTLTDRLVSDFVPSTTYLTSTGNGSFWLISLAVDEADAFFYVDAISIHNGSVSWTGELSYETSASLGVVQSNACGQVMTPPEDSGLVRSITVASDNESQNQYTFLAGKFTTKETPTPVGATNILGTSIWDANDDPEGFRIRERRSRRHRHNCRTDDLKFEVSLDGAGALLDVVDIEVVPGHAPRNPSR